MAWLRRRLLAWYDKNRRDLPWRDLDPPDPYATLVSEAMLQQTQVATVIPYYRRFMKRFPNVRTLAAARIDEVLRYWAGLGYYRRCHHLHAAARRIVSESHGELPRNSEDIRSLPGVGRYTAGAIGSIAFGRAEPAVDGNVRRVISRVMGFGESNGSSGTPEAVWSVAADWVSRRRPGDFNQALMELGATVCTPRQPSCSACPLRGGCAHRRSGFQPVKKAAGLSRSRTLTLVTVAIEHRGRLFFRRRPDRGLWAGLWEWPSELFEGDVSPRDLARAIVQQVAGSKPRPAIPPDPFHEMTHVLTHRRIRFQAYHVALKGAPRVDVEGRWIKPGSDSPLPLSSAQLRLVEALTHQETGETEAKRRRF